MYALVGLFTSCLIYLQQVIDEQKNAYMGTCFPFQFCNDRISLDLEQSTVKRCSILPLVYPCQVYICVKLFLLKLLLLYFTMSLPASKRGCE